MRKPARAAAVSTAAALAASAATTQERKARPAGPIRGLVDKLPTDDYREAIKILDKILMLHEVLTPPRGIRGVIVAAGQRFGDPDGVKPKYAVHGLVHHASRPGADRQRRHVAEALAAELAAKHSDDLKAFICRQLQLCGRNDQVSALAVLLGSDTLCEPATQALTAIGTPDAVSALHKALPGAKGKRRTTLVNALGRFGDKDSASEVRKDIAAEDADLRICAWFALGNMGDEGSVDALMKALDSESPYQRGCARDACLRMARRLGESGDPKTGEKICRSLLAKFKAEEDVHNRLASLATLAEIIGVKSVGDLKDAMNSKDLKLRQHAAWTAVDLAAAIRKEHVAESDELLKKVLEATTDEAVRQKAQMLLGEREVA